MPKAIIDAEVSTKDEATKNAIIDAAQKLFQHYGLNKTTMEDIAKSLGKSKSSLYYYYATKEDIFEAVVEKEKIIIFNEINAAVSEALSASDKFRTFVDTKFKEIRKRYLLHKILFDEIYDNVCLFKIIKKKYGAIELEIIKDILSTGIETGEFVIKTSDLDAFTQVCAITLRGIHLNFIFDAESCDSNQTLITAATDMLLKSLKK